MKKTYSKPDVLFEDFSLSTSIAAGCERKTLLPGPETCGFKFGADVVFVTGVAGCQEIVDDGSIADGFCYHTPSDAFNLFHS